MSVTTLGKRKTEDSKAQHFAFILSRAGPRFVDEKKTGLAPGKEEKKQKKKGSNRRHCIYPC